MKLFSGMGKWVMFINVALPALIAMMIISGNSEILVSPPSYYYVGGMFVVFLIGWFKVLSAYWNVAMRQSYDSKSLDRLRIAATLLVVLGLVGTLLGFKLSLHDVDFANATFTNTDAMLKMISTLASGMALAFETSLVGAIGSIFINLNIAWIRIMMEDRRPISVGTV